MNRTTLIIAIIGVLVIAGLVAWGISRDDNGVTVPPNNTNGEEPNNGDGEEEPTAPTVSRVSIALLDIEGKTKGKERGCDRIVLIERNISPTTQPLNGALRELFSIEEENIAGWFNYMPRTHHTLFFDRATLENGTAKIYLTGSLSGMAGVCDDPRAKIQIEETALQFPTVQRVELYLNGTRTDLQPSQR